MKKLLIAVLIIVIPFGIASPRLEIAPGEVNLKETMFFKVTNISEKIPLENIKFLKGRKKVFFEYDGFFYNGTNYFYAYADKEGSFNLSIERAIYREGGELKEFSAIKNFNITKKIYNKTNVTGLVALRIKPGFLYAGDTLTLENKGDIGVEFRIEKKKSKIPPGEKEHFKTEVREGTYILKIETYKNFEVLVIGRNKTNESKKTGNLFSLKPKKGYFSAKLTSGKAENFSITLMNIGDKKIRVYNVSSDIDFFKFKTPIEILPLNQSNLSLSAFSEGRGAINGSIIIEYSSEDGRYGKLVLPVEAFVFKKGVNKTNVREDYSRTCAEIGGKFCSEDEFCNGRVVISMEKKSCCLSNCEKLKKEKPSGSGWIFGIIILALLGIIGFWAYKKQKQVRGTPKIAIFLPFSFFFFFYLLFV